MTEGLKGVMLDAIDVVGGRSREEEDVASKRAVVGEKVEVVLQVFDLKAEGDGQ